MPKIMPAPTAKIATNEQENLMPVSNFFKKSAVNVRRYGKNNKKKHDACSFFAPAEQGVCALILGFFTKQKAEFCAFKHFF